MIMDINKMTPGGLPPSIREVETIIQQAIEKPELGQNLRVEMTVSGGVAGEQYYFHFAASGENAVELEMKSELTEQIYQPQTGELPRKEFVELLKKVNLPEMYAFRAQQVPIPPDSLVGRLTISRGEEQMSVIFMADPGQAETAGFELPPDLAELVDSIYTLTSRRLKAKEVRP
jgi:hypothetical protein